MTYSQKLRDPRWQKKRLEIFTRDNWTCIFCGAKERNLQCHHVVYRKLDPWDYPDDLYQTACEYCHSERTELTDKIVDSLRISLKNIPAQRLETAAARLMSEAMAEMGSAL
jgi:5-methylcytosine-specific restriction endonuclease McrA